MSFNNQVVAITGAAGNLGGALVAALKDSGAQLALIDHKAGRLGDLYPETAGEPHIAFIESIDITDEELVQQAISQIITRFERVDILINAAGGYSGGTDLEDTSLKVWERMMDLNARSVFLISRAILPFMHKQGRGVIVNVGARVALKGGRRSSVYSAAKSAVLRLTESLSAEVKRKGIRVNAVLPGTIDTPENREAMPDADFTRWVKPGALADVILFLCSDAARAIHGAAIPVYGT